ncbi:MAG TPA: DUF6188 family protein [Ignavibacteriales bacterium]|nr:DUF6188 family protein [Ignavibacteriales bacterium]
MKIDDDKRIWELNGHEVTRLLIDNHFTIQVWWTDKNIVSEALITIETPFTLSLNNIDIECNPEDGTGIAEALSVLHKEADSISASRSGELNISFKDGTGIIVGKHEYYESWSTQGKGELSEMNMLCSPHDGPPWKE